MAFKGSKYYMRRVAFIENNESDGYFDTRHVNDENMPADYLGKWVPIEKYGKSRAHTLNLSAQVKVAKATVIPQWEKR